MFIVWQPIKVGGQQLMQNKKKLNILSQVRMKKDKLCHILWDLIIQYNLYLFILHFNCVALWKKWSPTFVESC